MPKEVFTVDELAKAAGMTTRTVRFYSQEKLLPLPAEFRGRVALYTNDHLEKLKLIKILKDKFVPLAHIRKVVAHPEKIGDLKKKLEIGGDTLKLLGYKPPLFSGAGLAEKSGFTPGRIVKLTEAGFLCPAETEEGPRYSANDLDILSRLKVFIDFGFAVDELGFIPSQLEHLAKTFFRLGHDKLHQTGRGRPKTQKRIESLAKAHIELVGLLYQKFLRQAIDRHHEGTSEGR